MAASQALASYGIRPALIGSAGLAIMLLSAGAALVASGNGWSGSRIVAALLVVAGLLEMAAGALRRDCLVVAILAGAATALAGIAFTMEPATTFVPAVYLIIGWLGTRGLILLPLGLQSHGPVRTWILMSAATDFLLGVIVMVGLSAATLSIALFGPTPPVVDSFAWILAMSFIVTGIYLLKVANSERAEEFATRSLLHVPADHLPDIHP